MPQLDPTTYTSQLFWLGVVFLLLYGIIRYYFTPKFQALFQARDGELEKKLAKAQNLKREAETAAQSLAEKVESSHRRAHRLVYDAEVASQKALLKEKHSLALYHTKELSKLEKNLEQIRTHFSTSINEEMDLTRLLFEKVTPLTLDEDDYKKAIACSKEGSNVA